MTQWSLEHGGEPEEDLLHDQYTTEIKPFPGPTEGFLEQGAPGRGYGPSYNQQMDHRPLCQTSHSASRDQGVSVSYLVRQFNSFPSVPLVTQAVSRCHRSPTP